MHKNNAPIIVLNLRLSYFFYSGVADVSIEMAVATPPPTPKTSDSITVGAVLILVITL